MGVFGSRQWWLGGHRQRSRAVACPALAPHTLPALEDAERWVALITSACGYRGEGGSLRREFCVGKPGSCHAVGELKVSRLCDLLVPAQLWDRGLRDPLDQPCG